MSRLKCIIMVSQAKNMAEMFRSGNIQTSLGHMLANVWV